MVHHQNGFPFEKDLLLGSGLGKGYGGALLEEVKPLPLPVFTGCSVLAGDTGADWVIAFSMTFSTLLRPDFLSFLMAISSSSSSSLSLFSKK